MERKVLLFVTKVLVLDLYLIEKVLDLPDIRKMLHCVTAIRTFCEPNCVSTMTSASSGGSYHDLTAPRTWAQCDHQWSECDLTVILLWSVPVPYQYFVAVPRSYGDHQCFTLYMAPFHGKLKCFKLMFFFKCKCMVFILKMNWFHSSLNH